MPGNQTQIEARDPINGDRTPGRNCSIVFQFLPGARVTALVAGTVDEALNRPLIGISFAREPHARGHPTLRLIRHIAKIFHLNLIRRVESIGGAVGLIERAEGVRADAVKVKVVTVTHGATSRWSAAVTTARTIAPSVLTQPRVPSLMHKIAAARSRVRVGR